MKSNAILSAFAVLVTLMSLSSAHGQVIAVNFNNTYASSPENITSDTGVVVVAMADWNNVTANSGQNQTGFIDSSGNALSGFNFTSLFQGPYESQNTNLGNLLNGYADHFGSLTVNDIPYATYDVYMYVASDQNGRNATGTLDSETLSFSTAAAGATSFTVNSTPDANPATPTYGAYNTLLFQNVSGSSFTYDQAYTGNAVGFAGFEIVAVPEPSTWAMLFGGAALLVGAVRFRRQTI
jgi:hypothetical protein